MGVFLVIFLLIEAHSMHQKWVETRPAPAQPAQVKP